MSYRSKPKASLFLGASFFILAASVAPVMAQETAQAQESVIVTGTRVSGMSAADSAAPVTVLGSDALTHVGQIAVLRRLAGVPVKGENYSAAHIVAGNVGRDQAKAMREF